MPSERELLVGDAGTGKTTLLVERAAQLAADGERVTAIGFGRTATLRLARRIDATASAHASLIRVVRASTLAVELLRRAGAAGADPFLEPLPFADRLVMLLDRIGELPLRRHEIRGDPAGLLTSLLRRIEELKGDGKEAADLEAWAAELERAAGTAAEQERARREREFAAVFATHDRLVREASSIDPRQAAIEAVRLMRAGGDAGPAAGVLGGHVVADAIESARPVERVLLTQIAAMCDSAALALDPSLLDPEAFTAELEARAPGWKVSDLRKRRRPAPELRFWVCPGERAQADAVAAEIEAELAAGASPNAIAVCVDSGARDGRAFAAALAERGVPARVSGPAGFFQRAEIRDALAWLRLLADPGDSPAVVRALVRPPIELRPEELARCTAIARRRKLDMVAALDAALESPQLRPEGRDRVSGFLRLHKAASGAFEEMAPDLFVQRLIDRVGLRRGQLFSAHPDAVERLVNLSRLCRLASAWLRRHSGGTCREFARYAAVAADLDLRSDEGTGEESAIASDAVLIGEPDDLRGCELDFVFVTGLDGAEPDGGRSRVHVGTGLARRAAVLSRREAADDGTALRPAAAYEEQLAAASATEELREEQLFAAGEELHSTYRMLRDEALEEAWRAGASIGELRLDTHLDVHRSVARHLELLKLAALLQRPEGQSLEDALRTVDEALERVATPEQRQLLESSALDEHVRDLERGEQRRARAVAARREPSLDAFIPRRGAGLALSAGDIELYRTCPLKYKFGRVFAIPQEPTINQRFGIVVHQVLERFHAAPGDSLDELLRLFEASWRRGGFGTSDEELQFRDRAVAALTRFHERESSSNASTVLVERQFDLTVGPHRVRGRVDRVDRLPGGDYELIDYKTGRHKTQAELDSDVQLALYRLAAESEWAISSRLQSYWYVIDDEKVTLPAQPGDGERVERAVLETAQGIEAQDFEPRPSYAVCSWCEYRAICPAAET